jgi:hypothetical protein
MRVVGFKTVQDWARDVSAEVANEISRRCDLQMTDPPPSLEGFLEQYERANRQKVDPALGLESGPSLGQG